MFNTFKCNNFRFLVLYEVRNYSKSLKSNLNFLLETMPKEPKHIAEAQKQRQRIKERFTKYVPGRISLQVLGTGAEGAPRSLYVFSDQSRYLFNCGEGTQRLAHEHKMKLAKLEHIFVTQRSWRNIGGLPGTALTIQDVGVPQITLHGPKGLEELFTATKRFVILRNLKIEMADCSSNKVFQDSVMTVSYVPISKASVPAASSSIEYDTLKYRNNEPLIQTSDKDSDLSKAVQAEYESVEVGTSTKSTRNHHSRRNFRSLSASLNKIEEVEDDIDYYAHERKSCCLVTKSKRSRSRIDNRHSQVYKDKLSDTSRLAHLIDTKDESMCYICKLQPRPGALSLDKCVRHGVPSGPLLGKLKMGEDITLPSGVVVKSKDVCEPDDPGPIFLVVDCPTEQHLDCFVNNYAFKPHQAGAKKDEDLAYLVVHFTPQHVMDNPKYLKWVDRFSPSTHHLVLNETNKCMGSISVHRVQHKLNLLHKTIFPLLGDKGTKVDDGELENVTAVKRIKTNDTLSDNKDTVQNGSCNESHLTLSVPSTFSKENFTYANTFCNFHLRPRKGLDRLSELTLTPKEYVEEVLRQDGFPKILSDLETELKNKTQCLRVRSYPRLLFLGTGSCIPNKTRNTSGILLETSEQTNILIDCGEGTYGQIVRFFGPEKADLVLANIKAIFISHLHADHHIGIIGLLQGRKKALDKLNRINFHPVLLLAPKQILAWLNFYDKYFESICREFELIPNAELVHDDQTLFEGTKVRVNLTMEMSDICTAYVRHCPNAFGVAFTHRNGYKICYSGDTMPSENLIHAGMNCDLLIHEATMEDELEAEAVAKMHSTTSQAIEVGRNMCAKYILLTHFSQRYAKIPRFNDNFGDNIGIAFDNMLIHLDELSLVPLLYPALKVMFAEHYEELETKAVKRQLKLDRQEVYIKEHLSNSTSDIMNNSGNVSKVGSVDSSDKRSASSRSSYRRDNRLNINSPVSNKTPTKR